MKHLHGRKECCSSGGGVWRGMLVALGVVFLVLAVASLYAAEPAWWVNQGAVNPNAVRNDNAAANEGQLKQFTSAAVSEMNADFQPIGSGTALNTLVNGWIADYETNGYSGLNPKPSDFQVMTISQLKYIGGLVWTQLQSGSYTSTLPSWLVVNSGDSKAANLGQLKTVFDFDLTYSSDGSELPDWWIAYYQLAGSGATLESSDVPWSDGHLTYLQAFQGGLNPVDYYDGQQPVLTITGGNGQTGPMGGFAPYPLMVSVTNAAGNPLASAPVTFSVPSSSGSFQWSSVNSTLSTSVTVLTDSTGQAKAFYELPNSAGATCTVTATAGPPSNTASVYFTETSDDGSGGPYTSPFDPSNLVGTINADGSEDMSWQNNTAPSDTTPIPIWYWNPTTKAWFQIDSLSAGTTSYHVRPNPTPMP